MVWLHFRSKYIYGFYKRSPLKRFYPISHLKFQISQVQAFFSNVSIFHWNFVYIWFLLTFSFRNYIYPSSSFSRKHHNMPQSWHRLKPGPTSWWFCCRYRLIFSDLADERPWSRTSFCSDIFSDNRTKDQPSPFSTPTPVSQASKGFLVSATIYSTTVSLIIFVVMGFLIKNGVFTL